MLIWDAPSRPGEQDVLADVADKLTEDLLKINPLDDKESRLDILETLKQTLADNIDWDGYSLARNLDNYHGWSISTNLVETLDHANHIKYHILKSYTKDWVKLHDIEPQFSFGDEVFYKKGFQWKNNPNPIHRYSVVRILRDTAQYVISDTWKPNYIAGKYFATGLIVGYENVW